MKAKLLKLAKITVAVAILGAFGAGCAWSVGGKHGEACAAAAPPTRGKELIDLKSARDLNAISEQEYQEQKAKILSK